MNERLRFILTDCLRLDDEDARALTEMSSIHTVTNWDSLGHVRMVLALEQDFGVSIPNEEAVRLTSVKRIQDYLKSLRVEV